MKVCIEFTFHLQKSSHWVAKGACGPAAEKIHRRIGLFLKCFSSVSRGTIYLMSNGDIVDRQIYPVTINIVFNDKTGKPDIAVMIKKWLLGLQNKIQKFT